MCLCVCVCVCFWKRGGIWHQRESGIWLTVWLQLHTWAPPTCTQTNTATQMNTHGGQTLSSNMIGHKLTVVFNPLKLLYELTYTRHWGLIVCVFEVFFLILMVFLFVWVCVHVHVAMACNISTFPFLYIKEALVHFLL